VGDAKKIIVKPISAKDANRLIQALHYSGKHAVNPHINLGVFMGDRCGGAMQFGPSMQKSNLVGLVSGTLWNEFIELNRLAFADWLPRNGESRAIAYAMRWMRSTYPWLKWVVSFADGTQCGDGTIYRASGFVLTSIKVNSTMHEMPDGYRFADIGLRASSRLVRERVGYKLGELFSVFKKRTGCKRIPGFQLRYIYFLDPTAKDRLTVPILPFSEIERRGAGMYKGVKRGKQAIGNDQLHSGGAAPTATLQQDKRPKQAMAGDHPEQRECNAHPDAPSIKGGE
jgi:hypothetical protein